MCDQQSLRSACTYAQSEQTEPLKSLENSMSVKLLTEQCLEFLISKGVCTCSSESTLVKMPHFWKSHVTAHMRITFDCREKTDLSLHQDLVPMALCWLCYERAQLSLLIASYLWDIIGHIGM